MISRQPWKKFGIAALVMTPALASAETIEDQLERFHSNPKEFYSEHTQKYDANDNPLTSINPFLEAAGGKPDAFLKIKYRHRREIGKGMVSHDNKMLIDAKGDDRVEMLVDNSADIVRNIEQIDELGLREGRLPDQPWSADYWPIYRGILGFRFMDSGFPYVEDWGRLFKYITEFPFLQIFESGDAARIKTLATSEKYDLMVGDLQGTLTQNMWGQGKEYYDADGKVETWMGICHGWAAAAIMVPRPLKEISIPSYDGKQQLTFNPSEVKGLISYLWANTPYNSKFIGGRCNLKEVPRDENGRPTSQSCFDTNPGTWHLAVINQIGVAKRGFVMDATADYEVWNQPVIGYKVKYYNPVTRKEAATLKDGIVLRSDFKEDKWAKYRSPKTTHIVGVEMELNYIVEESANDRVNDSEEFDSIRKVRYLYDLELDAKMNVIGGEWYRYEHPDFLWIPTKNAKPVTYEDQSLKGTEWDGQSPTPKEWREAANWASQSGRVLSSIVDVLLKKSRE